MLAIFTTHTFLISFGAASGALLRFKLSALHWNWQAFIPLGTLLSNGLGCFLSGIFVATPLPTALSESIRLTFLVGFCGGLTTFSSFSLEGFALLREQQLLSFFMHQFSHLLLSMLSFYLGFQMTKTLLAYCFKSIN